MPESEADFKLALEELENYANDVEQITPQMNTNAIKRYIARLDSDPIYSMICNELPKVDFDAWYDAASRTGSSIRGTAKLDWPTDDISMRLALWIKFLRRISSDKISLLSHSSTFYADLHSYAD
jgi:hypothetical protein